MSTRWFSPLGSPSYLATVLHRYYRLAVDRSVFCTISHLLCINTMLKTGADGYRSVTVCVLFAWQGSAQGTRVGLVSCAESAVIYWESQ
jgi:hypothetical protein